MTTPEDPEPAEQSHHLEAIAKHNKKRTAQRVYLASGAVKPKRTRSTSRLVSRPIEPRPAYDGTTPEERREIASQESFQRKADTAAALAKPSVLTPLQIKRLERSERIKEAQKQEKIQRALGLPIDSKMISKTLGQVADPKSSIT